MFVLYAQRMDFRVSFYPCVNSTKVSALKAALSFHWWLLIPTVAKTSRATIAYIKCPFPLVLTLLISLSFLLYKYPLTLGLIYPLSPIISGDKKVLAWYYYDGIYCFAIESKFLILPFSQCLLNTR